jgi:hypothetical protein
MVDSIIRTARAGGVPSDDERWNPMHIAYLIHHYRAEFIYANAFMHNPINPEIDPQTVQDLGCVKLEEADQSECANVPWGCLVKKVSNVPKFIDLPGMAAVTYVGTIGKGLSLDSENFHYVSRETLRGRLSLRFAGAVTFWTMVGQTIYVITQNKELCWVNIAGVFEDPTAVRSFSDDGSSCGFSYTDDDYPVSRRMAEDIQQAILHNEIGVFLQTVSDEVNDSQSI